jgi:sulfur carrier protein ThiS
MPVFRLLEELHVLPESVLVLCNGQLLTEDQRVNPGDDVKIVAVVSGG